MPFDIARVNRLPSLPAVAVKLLDKFSDPDVSLTAIVEVIQSDPAITAKLMRAANSALYGVGRPITDLVRAVGLLGKKTVTSLALCFSLSEDSMQKGEFAVLYRNVWLQSILQATAAELIARRYDPGQEGEYFTAALLADIGRLAMLKAAPQEYAGLIQQTGNGSGAENCESNLAGTSHTDVSLALLERWGLPEKFRNAVRRRALSVSELAGLPPGDDRRLSLAVAFATAVANYFCQSSRGIWLARVSELGAEFYNLNGDDVRDLLTQIQNRVDSAADLFETDISRLGPPTDLMAAAMEQLSRLAAAAADGIVDDHVRSQLLDENGALKERIRELMRRSSIDALTGIHNRGYFDERLDECAALARAGKFPLGLLFLDADHFKKINDTFGHSAGDQTLRQVADVLARTVRADDILARYGGEEFVVLMANANLAALQSLGERLRAAIEQERIAVDNGVIRVTVSVGGAFLMPPLPETAVSTLLAAADLALYAAKHSGRNQVIVRNCHGDSHGRRFGDRSPVLTNS